MKATIPSLRFNRLAFLSVTAGVLVFLGWNVREKLAPAMSHPISAIGSTSEAAPQQLPFAFQDVMRYFEDALGKPPQERFANQVIFRGGTSREEFYTITVTRQGPELVVAFNVIDDYGMNLLREFFEAPFFQFRESEQFYALLNGHNVIRTLRMPRFDLFFEYNSPGLEANITMIFSPRLRSLSAPNP